MTGSGTRPTPSSTSPGRGAEDRVTVLIPGGVDGVYICKLFMLNQEKANAARARILGNFRGAEDLSSFQSPLFPMGQRQNWTSPSLN